jgi:predicted DNA-binding protein YlxM (UPF0122 family)
MANSKIFRQRRAAAMDAYLAGDTDTAALAERFSVSRTTIQKWQKVDRWKEVLREQGALERQADVARQRAIVTALTEFAADPKNVALQSLVSLLRNEQRRREPARELNDYIVKFLDQVTDFFLEKGYEGLLKEFQSAVHSLAEYLRVRNA